MSNCNPNMPSQGVKDLSGEIPKICKNMSKDVTQCNDSTDHGLSLGGLGSIFQPNAQDLRIKPQGLIRMLQGEPNPR